MQNIEKEGNLPAGWWGMNGWVYDLMNLAFFIVIV